LGRATLKQALYWSNIYTEILAMEEKVLRRIEQLMASQSAEARRESSSPICPWSSRRRKDSDSASDTGTLGLSSLPLPAKRRRGS